jgi:hypothetical protein
MNDEAVFWLVIAVIGVLLTVERTLSIWRLMK